MKAKISFFSVLSLATLGVILFPQYRGWDMAAYIALAGNTQQQTYAELQRALPPAIYQELIGNVDESRPDGAWEYRRDVFANGDHFRQQLPFYTVKPLHIVAIWALSKLGVPLFTATHLMSAVSFFVIGLVSWTWLSRYLSPWLTMAAGLTIVLQPFVLQAGRSYFPDAMSMALLISGAYFLWEQPKAALAVPLLLLSILARPDNLIFCFLAFALDRRFLYALASGCVYLANNYFAHAYSWSTLFYHSFIRYLPAPADATVHVTPSTYFQVLLVNSEILLVRSEVVVVATLGIWALIYARRYRAPILILLGTMLLHHLAFPAIPGGSERYFSPDYLLILLIAAIHLLTVHRATRTLPTNRAYEPAIEEMPVGA